MTVNKEKVLEDIYVISTKSDSDAIDYLFEDFPIVEKNFDLVNQILMDLDLTNISGQFLYQLTFHLSSYVHYLPYYNCFYDKVIKECESRGYSDKRILNLFENLKNGSNHQYDPNYVHPPSDHKVRIDLLNKKIEAAQLSKDKELESLLNDYKFIVERNEWNRKKHIETETLLGDVKFTAKVVECLRAMADKIEQPGPHFIYDAQLPHLPICDVNEEFGMSHVSVTLLPYPMGG